MYFDETKFIICFLFQNSRTQVDQEYKTKYRELQKLFASMDDAAQFMKNKNSCRDSKTVLILIKNSLPVLELHLRETYLNDVCTVLLKKTKYFDMNDEDWSISRHIALNLMANSIEWVQGKFYRLMADMVRSVLVGDETTQTDNEKCLTLLCDVGLLTEICCHGLSSTLKEVIVIRLILIFQLDYLVKNTRRVSRHRLNDKKILQFLYSLNFDTMSIRVTV